MTETALEQHILTYMVSPEDRVTAIASAFAASLELARRQDRDTPGGVFEPIPMRRGPSHGTMQVLNEAAGGLTDLEDANLEDDERGSGRAEDDIVGDELEAARIAEALVFATPSPSRKPSSPIASPRCSTLRAIMLRLQEGARHRGVNLVRVGDAWAFRADLSFVIRRDENEVRKLSRAHSGFSRSSPITSR